MDLINQNNFSLYIQKRLFCELFYSLFLVVSKSSIITSLIILLSIVLLRHVRSFVLCDVFPHFVKGFNHDHISSKMDSHKVSINQYSYPYFFVLHFSFVFYHSIILSFFISRLSCSLVGTRVYHLTLYSCTEYSESDKPPFPFQQYESINESVKLTTSTTILKLKKDKQLLYS